MAAYLLDSSSLINYGHGRPPETEWLRMVLNGQDTVGSCAIVLAECLSGATERQRAGWLEIFGVLVDWAIVRDDAVLAGRAAYDFARRGVQLSVPDGLIAAVALRVGATVVTENVRDFPQEEVTALSLGSGLKSVGNSPEAQNPLP